MAEKPDVTQRRKTLGALLRSARIRTGHSRVQCANSLNVTTRAIADFEVGKSDVTVTQLQRLAAFFELPVAYFLNAEAPGGEDNADIDQEHITHQRMTLRQKLIGVQLRSARTNAGKTQRDCAALLRVSTRNISEYERGIRDIPIVELEVLSRFLGIPLARFMEPCPEREEDSPAARQEALAHLKALRPGGLSPEWAHLTPELREFVAAPANTLYLQLALKLSQLPASAMREIGEALLDITY